MSAVFFADVLGFSALSRVANATPAVDALSDLASIFSTQSSVARYLQAPAWRRRYGLSDSIFLVADDPMEACAAAAEIFFNLAFYNSQADDCRAAAWGNHDGRCSRDRPALPRNGQRQLGW